MQTHFPKLEEKFEALIDPRDRKEYSMSEILTGALFMFIFKETTRNAYNNDRRDAVFRKNFYKTFKLNLPHADAIDAVMRELASKDLERIKTTIVSALFEQKLFRSFRFLGKYYFVAIDATGMASFDHRHCSQCLTRTSKNGKTTYFHYVLEAKLVTSSGLCVSLATEFIENPCNKEFDKQDCELKAFVRIAKKLKKNYPRLPICILADSLYPNNTVFDICEKNNWLFIINLKDTCLKTFQEEVSLLKNTAKRSSVLRSDKSTRASLEYAYLNKIEYGKRTFSWVECYEEKFHIKDKKVENKHFVYITNILQTAEMAIQTADSGRLRWKIENEGFNTLKNQGYELEHKYSRVSYTAMQNYYHILQIAHVINQLVERSKAMIDLLEEHSKETIVNIWKKLIAYLTMVEFYKEIENQPG
jgi:Transposase DDE domain